MNPFLIILLFFSLLGFGFSPGRISANLLDAEENHDDKIGNYFIFFIYI